MAPANPAGCHRWWRRDTVALTHRFVTTALGTTHCMIGGAGPLVLVLPAGNGPQAIRPVAEALAARFSVVLIDIPGYGLSDALPQPVPAIRDYAVAVAALLRALGIRRCGILGSHTGAAIAAELAVLHPDLCAALVLHELSVFTPPQREDMLAHYLPAYTPEWTGSYLAAFWHRYREQMLFRPWHLKAVGNRQAGRGDDVTGIHDMFLLQAAVGDGYRKCYEAVIRNDLPACLRAIAMPFSIVAHDETWLTPSRGIGAGTIALWPAAEMAARCTEIFQLAAGDTLAPSPETGLPTPRALLPFGPHHIMVRTWPGAADGLPSVILPHIPGTASAVLTLAEALSQSGPVLVPDLPGHGDSFGPPDALSVESYFAALAAVTRAAGYRRFRLIGVGTGAVVAAAAAMASDAVAALCLVNAPYLLAAERAAFARHYAPEIALTWDGTHLLRLWHALRNEELFWPWYEQAPENTRRITPDLDVQRLDRRVIGVLRHRESYAACYQSFFQYDLIATVARLDCKLSACTVEGALFAELGERLSAVRPDVMMSGVPRDPAALARAIGSDTPTAW